MRFSLGEIADATGGRVSGGAAGTVVSGYHTDSRQVLPGGLFFALTGASMDGHEFVAAAAERGAAAAVVTPEHEHDAPALARVVVPDPWRALYELAALALDRVRPLVVGVTGSNGKTSTKEMIAAVLAARYDVHRTPGNLNTETGVPLTVLGLEPHHTALVLEMGMRRRGEIADLARLARPRIGVVTFIGSVHAEFFADGRDGIAAAKGELVEALPGDGLAVLNADDAYFARLSARSAAPVVGFGFDAGELRGEGYRPLEDGGCAFSVRGTGVSLSLAGRHQARNALAALAVGEEAGVALADGAARLADVRVGHRLQELTQPGGWTLVDDAYNASPESMRAAFAVMDERRPARGRLLAVLGEMRELGPLAEEAHRAIGAEAAGVFARIAVLDRGWGRVMGDAAGAELVPDADAAVAWVRRNVRPGDRVLVKSSLGTALYEVVEQLKRSGQA